MISFPVLINFPIIQCCGFRGRTLLVPWNFQRISQILILEILCSLVIAGWYIFSAVFTFYILISLEISTMNLDVSIFIISKKKKSVQMCKNICISGVEHFFFFKTRYLDWFMWGGRKPLHGHFREWSRIFPSHSQTFQQNMIIWYGNNSNRANSSSVKKHNAKHSFIS